jgi:hypothetical protein
LPCLLSCRDNRVNGSKNLIMGFCARQSLSQLTPFIASLRHTTFAGDVCLLIEDTAAPTVDRLRALGVIVERAAPSAQQSMATMSSRYFSYLDFLVRNGDGYANVMLTDPATSVFQADPFGAPLPADIVYTSERRRIGETPMVYDAIVQAYGEAVAHNIRDCPASNASVSLGTRSGMLRYLTAMTHQFAGRTMPVAGMIDQGVHNYVVHMRPLAGAWQVPADRIASALHTVTDNMVEITDRGVVIDADPVPVLSHWAERPKVAAHVGTSPRFRLDDHSPPGRSEPASAARDAVVAFYQRQRDAGWLELFLGSLRCVSVAADVHCVGAFDDDELAILTRFRCTAHVVPATEPAIAENIAHFYINQVLDRIASGGTTRPDQVLVLDNVRAVFPRDPFLARTVGLSVFCEGPTRIGESDYNRDRLGLFVPLDGRWLAQPVISSMLLRGSLPVLREFYRRMFIELVGRSDILKIHKVVQGLVNKLCHGGALGFPVIAHPNGAEVHFEFLASNLGVDTRHGVRVGGTVPGVVLSGHKESQLLLKLRIDLNLPEA